MRDGDVSTAQTMRVVVADVGLVVRCGRHCITLHVQRRRPGVLVGAPGSETSTHCDSIRWKTTDADSRSRYSNQMRSASSTSQ
jgi:hypothetical protein